MPSWCSQRACARGPGGPQALGCSRRAHPRRASWRLRPSMSATNRRGTATSAYRTALVGRAPMTLANMRHNGGRSLAVRCELCHHEAVVNVAASTAGGEIALRKLDAMEADDEDAAPAFLSGHIQATTGHLLPLPAHEFGLYQLTIIAQACESEADKQKRATAVEN